jgi:arylformamidase
MAQPIFRGYDRAALDREYDNRKKVPNAQEILAWFARESEITRQKLAGRYDVPYGASPGERLDIFPAVGDGPAPVQVFIHGGYWHRLDKADFSYVARAFVPAGAAAVIINYALMPAVTMDELVRQCRAAVAWVHQNARSFGGDAGRIFVSGHSAGGHLTAMVMATDWSRFGVPAEVVAAGGGISGLYDLEPIRLCYLNDVLNLSPEDVGRSSPVRLAPPPTGRLILAVGGLEGPEYHRQTYDLAAAWRRHGLGVEVLDLPGHDHFSIAAQLGDPDSALSRAIRGQMGLA